MVNMDVETQLIEVSHTLLILNKNRFLMTKKQANIHQSLSSYWEIVTLYHILETLSVLLMLKFVPDQDLYYFFKQVYDRYKSDSFLSWHFLDRLDRDGEEGKGKE